MFKAIANGIKGVIKKVKDKKEEMDKAEEEQQFLSKWQARLEDAMGDHHTFRSNCATYDELYNNSKSIGANLGKAYMSDKTSTNTKDARQVIGLTYQLIESQIDITVPSPRVDELEQEDGDKKQMVEGQLKHFSESDELKIIVSENERICKKNSYAIMKVCYDPEYDGHTYRGKIKIVNPHPVNVVFQKNVYRIKDMQYLWHIENRDIDSVCQEYGEEFSEELETDGAEYNYLEDFSATTTQTSTSKGIISVVECWYKDKDGDINVLTWANDVILAHKKKFFYKKDLIEENGIFYEMVSKEEYDEQGNIIGYQDVKVRAKIPKDFPFVQWFNVPKEKSVRGKADPEIIYDQQEAIKKVMSNEEERLLKGNTKIIARKGSGIANKINNSVTQVIETDNPTQDVYVIDMKTQDRSLKDYYEIMKQAAKDSLGVTDASQGIVENQALSGRAIEQLSANSTGRLSSKLFQKHIAFSQLYRMCLDFMVAFYDDKRPFRYDNENEKVYGYFNKSDLIKQDSAGEWYYPDFDISITTDSGLPKDRRFLLDFINKAGQRIDNIQYWTMAESIGIPGARKILDMLKSQQEQMPPQQQEEEPVLSPHKAGMGGNIPLQQPQPNMLDDILQSLDPETLAKIEANPQLLKQIMTEVMQGGGMSG